MLASRRPLGAGVGALIAIDAVLVLAFLVLLVRALPVIGPGVAADDASPTAVAEPVVVFASPTRNISCAIAPDSARCEIAHFMYATPTLEGCSGSVGHEIEVTEDGARWVCRTGSPPPTPAADIANLDWGDSIVQYGFTCMSTGNGVTCTHEASGHSFHLERRDYTLG